MADTVAADAMKCTPKVAEQGAEIQPAPEAHAGDKRAADEVSMDRQPPVKQSKATEEPAPTAAAETPTINQPLAEAEGKATSEAAAEPEEPGGAGPSSVTPAKAEAKPGKAGAKKGGKKGGKTHADLEAFVAVLLKVPAGSTITFQEVMSDAGKGSPAHVSKAIASIKDESAPWWRVVYASGKLPRGKPQLKRLQEEGARPQDDEDVAAWAKRTGAQVVASYESNLFTTPDNDSVKIWDTQKVEPFASEAAAAGRHFERLGADS
eukprot:jgi/Astpho2/3284/fgenesh1_pg.00053_%23_16_t